MGAVAYTEAFGEPGHEQLFRQLRASGVPLVTHAHHNADLFPYAAVDVVPLRANLADQVVAGVRRLRARHPYRLPMSVELKLMDTLLHRGATTVHAHHGASAARIAPVARRLDCRLLATFHHGDVADDARDEYRRALREVFSGAARVLATTRAVAKRVLALGCAEDRLEVLPFGVALRPMRPRRPHNNGSPVRVMTASRLHPANGVAEVVDAVALARRMGARLRLDVVGDGPDREEVMAHMARSGLGDDVRMCGDLSAAETRRLMDAADIFVLHRSAAEGDELPAALLEAMASGLCVLATRTGSVAEAIRHEVTGVLLDGPDVSGLAAALVRATREPGFRVAMGAAGRACVERDFDLAGGVERLFELYR
jgi:glycosyltransferase involved in cell wall biosynthesis